MYHEQYGLCKPLTNGVSESSCRSSTFVLGNVLCVFGVSICVRLLDVHPLRRLGVSRIDCTYAETIVSCFVILRNEPLNTGKVIAT